MTVRTILQLSLFAFFVLHLFFSSCSNAEDFDIESQEVKRSQFPDNFLFGTATSSYQVEGGYLDDGKGLSNWDFFSHIPGNIKNNENGDVADDDYHLFLEDIELAHSLGVNAYRFSISWARILPKGRFGEVNPSGIKFYNNITDNILLRGIEPFVTICHHDHPQVLEDRYGAWLSPLMQKDFVVFAETCFKSFGERVKYWTTINEANQFADMAYIRGVYPPAHCSAPFGNCSVGNSDIEPLIALHNMLLAHAKAVKVYREHFQPKQGGSVGLIAHSHMYEPLRDGEPDREAVKRALAFTVGWYALQDYMNMLLISSAMDPLVFGDYPREMRQYHGSALPRFTPEETEYVKGSLDFIGINHYSTLYAKDCIHSPCVIGGDHFIRGFAYTTGERDGILIGKPTGVERFYVVPRGMEKIVEYVSKRYNNMPIYVTENGYSPPLTEQVPDLLHDVDRIRFHKGYLAALARAISTKYKTKWSSFFIYGSNTEYSSSFLLKTGFLFDMNGADVRGYLVWSLLDNFEWAGGYSATFGLYYIDRQTLKRTSKLSAKWFKEFLGNSSRGSNREEFKNGKEGSKCFPKSKNNIIARTEAKASEI